MNPDDRPRTLSPDRVEWIPSSPDELEVRVFGTWHGPTVPPSAALLLNGERVEELGTPPGDDVPPAWSAAFLVPVEVRSAIESGEALLDVGGVVVGVPPATPGRMIAPASDIGTLIDPAVLAERRARRAEIAEQSAAERAASAEEAASTLRTQLEHLEERLVRAAEERDSLASRVADAERRLRLAEQREEAERRRRGELEEELAAERRSVEDELRELSDRLSSAEEVTEALERELVTARRREEAERAARAHVDAQLREALERVSALEGASDDEGEELRRQAAFLADRLAEAEAERARLEAVASDLEQLRRRLAEAERQTDDITDLRRRLDEAERERGEVDDLRSRLADAERAKSEVEDLRSRLADAERAKGDVDELRRRLAAAEAERDELRGRVDVSAPSEAGDADALRAEIAELRRRLDETLAELDDERAAHAAAERARQLAAQRTQEERAAREAAERRGGGDPSAREQQLAEQVAALEAEIAERAETHRRVQAAIETVRSELGRVRAQVAESRSPQVDALTERVGLLEDLVRRRETELETTRAALADAERLAEEARTRGTADADTLRAAFESRIGELTAAVAEMRERLRETTSDFERRLAEERGRREAAEAALAALEAAPQDDSAPEAEPPVDAAPASASAEAPASDGDPAADDALEALIAGLREQVDSAREQLRAWDEPAKPVPAAPADATRDRLRAIEADIRATVSSPEASVPARDVIASLQQAADRLRAAAEEELAHIEAEEAPAAEGPRVEVVGAPADVPAQTPSAVAETPDVPAETPAPAESAAPPPSVELESRAIDFGASESPWLRTALERLGETEPARAADLLVSLLPVQAMAGVDLTYVVTAPTLGAVRVALASGSAQIERRPTSLGSDARISGSIATLAPLVAGGGSWRPKGVRIEGAKRPAKKLLRRRRPVGLGDFALITPSPEPGLMLAALAAAVEPSWTRGHRFGVAYEIGDERWTVVAADGEPLTVKDADEPYAAAITLTREALLPVLQGAASTATVAGDRRAVDVLHAWFDRARGVAAG